MCLYTSSDYSISIGNDVWIGYGALILPGVKIGDGSIIGVRSVVAKDIEPYSIFVENKVIKKRFSKEIIEKLSSINWENIRHKCNDSYAKWVTTNLNEENIDEILDCFTQIQS